MEVLESSEVELEEVEFEGECFGEGIVAAVV